MNNVYFVATNFYPWEWILFRGHEFYVVGTTFISWLRTIFRGNDFYFINMARIKKKYPKHICHKTATVNWQEMLKKEMIYLAYEFFFPEIQTRVMK